MARRWNLPSLKGQRGGAEVFIVAGVAAVMLFVVTYIGGSMNGQDLSLESEVRSDLSRVIDKVSLGLASEAECRTAFTSAPLNGLNFTAGDAGTEALNMAALPARGVNLVAVDQPITGGKISKVWLENAIVHPNVGALRYFEVNLKIRGESGALRFPAVVSQKMGVLVDNANKIQYCFLNDSAAMQACQSIGGIYDPTKTPQCRFTFTGSQCNDPKSCVRGVNAAGKLICSAPIPLPPPPPPSYLCFCIYPPNPTPIQTWSEAGCSAALIPGAGDCYLVEI